MDLDAILARGRAAAEARMRDQVRLYRQDPDTFDRTTGNTVPGQQHDLYQGKGQVKPIAQAGEDAQAAEREVRLLEYEVSMPWDTVLPGGERVLPGARIEVTASRDARMVGLVLWVTGAQFGDQVTAWRIKTEDRS